MIWFIRESLFADYTSSNALLTKQDTLLPNKAISENKNSLEHNYIKKKLKLKGLTGARCNNHISHQMHNKVRRLPILNIKVIRSSVRMI